MNVFMIETAHQLLNAIEAKYSLNLKECHLLILTSVDYPQHAYDPLLRAEDWKTVRFLSLEISVKSDLQRYLKTHQSERVRGYFHQFELMVLRRQLDRLAHSLGKVQNVFLGNYWIDYMRHFANALNYQRVLLLDDGTQTLQINDRRRKGGSLDQYTASRRLRITFLNTLIGMKVRQAPKVTFFTLYDLQTKDDDQVIKHDYSYLRSLAGESPSSDEIYFLGSELREEGLSVERYLDYFRQVLSYFDGEKLVYVRHKRECSDQIGYIRDALGVKVINFGVPIEFQLTLRQSKPKLLASFCSSALENCRIIFGDKLMIKSFYIDPEEFLFNADLIREIYEYYDRKGTPTFQVINSY